MSDHRICACGHGWLAHRIAAPHPCKDCPCTGWTRGWGPGGRPLNHPA